MLAKAFTGKYPKIIFAKIFLKSLTTKKHTNKI